MSLLFELPLCDPVESLREGANVETRTAKELRTATLELLSAACVESHCRDAIREHCTPWLQQTARENKGFHQALAALILTKTGAESETDITPTLERLVLESKDASDQAIEGLAYVSLQPPSKEIIARNKDLLESLTSSLKEHSQTAFGCLTVLANLTRYKPMLTEEQKKMTELKDYANSSKPRPDDPLDDDAHVAARCSRVLNAGVIPGLVGCWKMGVSLANTALVVSILLSLAKDQKNRAKMALQGSVKLLLQIREKMMTQTKESSPEVSAIEQNASHALARLLISINPAHIFSSSLPAPSAISALLPLLHPDTVGRQRNLLPTFEALMALTNIASMDDNSIRDLEVRLVWTALEDELILSSNTMIQRASMELVCNLMASPQCVAKFVADGGKHEARRMQILLAMADVEDLATRRAAGGALAMLTEWDAAVTAVLEQKDGKGPIAFLRMCEDESDEMKHRGFVCLANLANAPGAVGKRGADAIKKQNGQEVLKGAMRKTKSPELLSIGIDVLKKLM